jgi:hypothetical protein
MANRSQQFTARIGQSAFAFICGFRPLACHCHTRRADGRAWCNRPGHLQEKKQKTFISGARETIPAMNSIWRRSGESKSLLVLFFRKEHFADLFRA